MPHVEASIPAPRDSVRAPRAAWWVRPFLQEDINFLVTNRLPRRALTIAMGWFSRLEIGWVRRASIAIWKRCSPDLDLSDAEHQEFRSLHDCFIRRLKPGSRPIHPDPDVLVSPCDSILGAHGRVDGTTVFQAKGFPYTLEDLLPHPELVERHRDGLFATLRLKSSFYHRFHAPCAGSLREVTYVSGDTWNVNPIALRRVERLFCKNERAVLAFEPDERGVALTLVPVAAILVASLRIHALADRLHLRYRGPNVLPCNASFEKGDELGYFEHGSTVLVFASGPVTWAGGLEEGDVLRVGEPLLRHVRRETSESRPGHGLAPCSTSLI